MSDYIYYIILPGLSYTANGPIWIDKLEISAFFNNTRCELLDLTNKDTSISNTKFIQSLTLYSGIDYTDCVDDKNPAEHTIQSINYNNEQAYFNNSSYNKPNGLCAVLFNGSVTDYIIFNIDIYTSKTWIMRENTEYVCQSTADSEYKKIDSITVKYNPFINANQKAEVQLVNWVKQKVTIDKNIFANLSNYECFQLTSNSQQNIYLDDQLNLTVKFEDLPYVCLVGTSSAYKACMKNWFSDKTITNIADKINGSKCNFLLFDWNLPTEFGKNADTDSSDQLAICAYRKSKNGSVAYQRYTLIGVEKNNISSDLKWSGSFEYDYSSFIDSVQYYSSQPFKIQIEPKKAKDLDIKYVQTTKLYDNYDNTFTLQSGCSWAALINSYGKITETCTYDIWSDYKAYEKYIWTKSPNRGQSLPTELTKITYTPELNTKTITISSSDKLYSGKSNIDIQINTLSNVQYLTFLDTSYEKRKFADLVHATNQLAHPVENSYIQVKHTPTKFIFENPGKAISIEKDFTNVPTSSNYQVATVLEFKSQLENNGKDYGWPLDDSQNGVVECSNIITQTNLNIKPSSGITLYNQKGSLQVESKELIYYLKKGQSITVEYENADNSIYILKWTQVYVDNDNNLLKPNFNEKQKLTESRKLMKDGIAIIEPDRDVLISSIGVIPVTDLEQYAMTTGIIHSFGCYESKQLFGNEELSFNRIYFPPSNTLCLGFYHITSSPEIKEEDLNFLYSDIPQKNQTVKQELINIQYKK